MRPAVGLAANFGYRAGSSAAGRIPGDFAQEASVEVESATVQLVEARLVALVEADLVCLAADCSMAATVCRSVAHQARPVCDQAAAHWDYWVAAGSDSQQSRSVDWD